MTGLMDSFRLDGKVAWVTGASYGLGMAYAMAFAEAGATVVFNSSNKERVDNAVKEYKAAGFDVYGDVCDVTDEEQVNDFVRNITDRFGTINILVNNAGIIRRIPMHEMSLSEWNRVMDVDLTGPFICSKAVIPGMIEAGGGKIINACSMMSEFGRETVSAYAAAKGGLKMLTRNICSEYGRYNIQCNGIGPGYIATPQTAPLRARSEDGSMNPFDRFIRSKTPAQRWGHPEELKGLAVFLASPASDFVNGQVIYIDGGISAYIGQDPGNLDESKLTAEKEDDNIIVKD